MFTRFIALGLLLAVVSGCSQGGAGSGGTSSSPEGGAKRYRIAVIPKGTTNEFWKSVHAGAENAAKELKIVDLIWKGPLLEDDRDGQINVVQGFITSGVDGICLAPLDSQALVQYVREAKQEGIPTVIFDSALADPENIVSYVATDNFHGGVLAARRMAELLGNKGRVILLRYAPGSESTEQREEGFLATLKKEFPEIVILSSDQYSDITAEKALEKSQSLLVRFRDQVDGIFAVNESNSIGMLGAIENAGLAGKVKFIAFDPNQRLIQAMVDGKVHGIVLQDPVRMGYLAVKTMVAHLKGEKVEKRVSTGEAVATAENLKDPATDKLLHPEQFQD